ncbi:MAG: FTR1 family protein [Anaerolineae bacterium]|nr:FTR1 family protein [Anaerolineae bacterium]
MRKGLALLLLLVAVLLVVPHNTIHAEGGTPAVNVAHESQAIRDLLQQAMRAYRLGDYQAAFKLSRAAYLDHFENIEIPLRALDGDLTLDLEYRFAELRTKMQQGAPASVVEAAAQRVRDGVDEVDAMFTSTGVLAPTLAAVSGFSVIFREGLEAVLVLAALLGYLRASQSQSLGRYIFFGVGLAILASVFSWLIVHYLVRITPLAREVLEAVISLIAVGVLFWVNFWLIRRLDQKRWMEFMRARAWSAMASGSAIGLVILGFTAVYREGLETALFYEVLALMSANMEIYLFAGFVAGVVALAAITWVILKTSRRLPIQRFFQVTVTLIMVLSVAFLGSAVHSFQESGFIGATSLIGTLPRLPHVLATFTGFHPTVETITAQLLLIVVYASGWIVMQVRQRRLQPVQAAQRVASA